MKSIFSFSIGRILLWLLGVFTVILSSLIVIFQLLSIVINHNPNYQQKIISSLQERTESIIKVEDAFWGWNERNFPSIKLRNVNWSSKGETLLLKAKDASVTFNPFAYFYKKGSLFQFTFNQGDLLLSQKFLETLDEGRNNIRVGSAQLNWGVSFNKFRVLLKEDKRLVLDVENNHIKIREGELQSFLNADIKLASEPIMSFRSSLNFADNIEDSYLYFDIESIIVDDDQLQMFFIDNLPQDRFEYAHNLLGAVQRMQGNGSLWVSFEQDGRITLKNDIQMSHLTFDIHQNINIKDISFVSQFVYNYRLSQSNWQWNLAKLDAILYNTNKNYNADLLRHVYFKDILVSNNDRELSIISPSADFGDISYFAIQILPNQDSVQHIIDHAVTGLIKDLSIRVAKNSDTQEHSFILDGRVEDISLKSVPPLPGVTNVSGNIALRDNIGWMELDDYNSELFIPKVYDTPFIFGYTKGLFIWEWIEAGELFIAGTAYDIKEGNLSASMELELHSIPLHHGYIDLLVSVKQANLQQVKRFIPWPFLNQGTSAWLDDSLIGGEDIKAVLSMRADVKDMGSSQTIFELGVSVDNPILQYRKEREPIISQKADVFMDQDRLTVLLPEGGQIGNIANIKSGYGVVDLASTNFTLGGDGIINIQELPALLEDYLLGDKVNFFHWEADGIAEGMWEFNYGLRESNFQGMTLDLKLKDGRLTALDYGHEIKDINGNISFSKFAGYGGDWSALMGSNLLIGKFATQGKDNFLQIQSSFVANEILPHKINKYISGSCDFVLFLYLKEKGAVEFSEYLIESNLLGLELSLHYPLIKKPKHKAPTKIFGQINSQESAHYIEIDNKLHGGIRFNQGIWNGLKLEVPAKFRPQIGLNRKPKFTKQNIANGIFIAAGDSSKTLNITAWENIAFDNGLIGLSNAYAKDNLITKAQRANNLFDGLLFYIKHAPYWDIALIGVEWNNKKYDEIRVNYNKDTYPWIKYSLPNSSGKILALAKPRQLNIITDSIYFNGNIAPTKGVLNILPKELEPFFQHVRVPNITLQVEKVYYDNTLLGNLNIAVNTDSSKLKLKVYNSTIIGLDAKANFNWLLNPSSHSKLALDFWLKGDLTDGVISTLDADDILISLNWSWEGNNNNFSKWYDTARGNLVINTGKGNLVSDRVNILTNLLSILNVSNLADTVRGNPNSISSSRLVFKRIKLNMYFEPGLLTIDDEVNVDLTFLNLRATGSYILKDRQLNHRVVATSPSSKVLPVAALLLGASSVAPLLLAVDIAGGEFVNSFSSAVYNINGTLSQPQISLILVGDVSGKVLQPDDLTDRINIQESLKKFSF